MPAPRAAAQSVERGMASQIDLFSMGVRTFVPPLKRGGDTSARCPYRKRFRTTVVGASRRDARAACSGAICRARNGLANRLVLHGCSHVRSAPETGRGHLGEVSLPQAFSHNGGGGISPRCPAPRAAAQSVERGMASQIDLFSIGVRTFVPPLNGAGPPRRGVPT